MNKRRLIELINRYNLAGSSDAVNWIIKDGKLHVNFITEERTVLGNIVMNKFTDEIKINGVGKNITTGTLGVYTTSQLTKLLSVLEEEFSLSLFEVTQDNKSLFATMKFKDQGVTVTYVLSDPDIIPTVPTMKNVPEYNVTIKIDTNFINTFIKAQNAMPDKHDAFVVAADDKNVTVTIGDPSTANSNNVIIEPEVVGDFSLMKATVFSSRLFKEVLAANRDCKEALYHLSDEGLSNVKFVTEDFEAEYFLLALESEE